MAQSGHIDGTPERADLSSADVGAPGYHVDYPAGGSRDYSILNTRLFDQTDLLAGGADLLLTVSGRDALHVRVSTIDPAGSLTTLKTHMWRHYAPGPNNDVLTTEGSTSVSPTTTEGGFWSTAGAVLQEFQSTPTGARIVGTLRMVGGLLEVAAGAGVIAATGPIGALPGVGLIMIGCDEVVTGFVQVAQGTPQDSIRSQLTMQLTGSPTAAIVADVGLPLLFGGLGALSARAANAAAKGNRMLSVRSGVQKQIQQVRRVLDTHPGMDMALEKGWNGTGDWLSHLRGLAAQGDKDASAMVAGVERDLTPLLNRLNGLERQLRQMDLPRGLWELP